MSRGWLAGVLLGVLSSGCASTTTLQVTQFEPSHSGRARVVIMPLDIELSSLGAVGMRELRVDWTQAAQRHVMGALRERLGRQGADVVAYVEPTDPERGHTHTQLQLLHAAVGETILEHKVAPGQLGGGAITIGGQTVAGRKLPSMKDRFDWGLGDDAVQLGDEVGADYALFLFVRDSYTSAGRAVAIVAAAALGTGMAGGQQTGFASLVDLSDGEIVWFNYLFRAAGDLREPEPAATAVKYLLEDFPL